nr:hypothetical protein [Pilimelia terevasa]
MAGVGGCGLFRDDPAPPHPLAPLLAETDALVAAYGRTMAAQPALAARLEPVHAAHTAHAAALRAAIGAGAGTPAPDAGAAAPGVAALRRAEQAAQRAAAAACLSADGVRATLLGEIAAARATHLEVLP